MATAVRPTCRLPAVTRSLILLVPPRKAFAVFFGRASQVGATKKIVGSS